MIKGKYFKWLLELIDCDADTYGYLMVALFKKEFYWTINADENRAEDGKLLRELFLSEKKLTDKDSELSGPCSVLEMMVALARRWQSDLVSDDGSYDGFEVNFWEMIENLGLKDCTNAKFVPENVDEKLNILLDRDYFEDGRGSLFLVQNHKVDQKLVEIWYQLQGYLNEKDKNC